MLNPAHDMPVRVAALERTSTSHGNRLADLEHAGDRLERSLRYLARRVALYAAAGSILGGALVAGVVAGLS